MTADSRSAETISLPADPRCDSCDVPLQEPFGWCSNCAAAYCLDCGRRHFCQPSCRESGCLAGLCVRLVRDGRLSTEWGLANS